jgi:spore germination protein GerM
MTRSFALRAGIGVFVTIAGWTLFFGLPKWYGARRAASVAAAASTVAAAPQPQGTAVRKITATLFYVSEDGMALTQAQREVPFSPNVAAQARAIIEAQLAQAPPLVSAIPSDTKLREVFVTERGDAFVDLSGEVAAKHPGGSLDEIFTVYTIVNALTVNLPAIARVQILIDGKEVDTLAGHVDLRHPLTKNMEWISQVTATAKTSP